MRIERHLFKIIFSSVFYETDDAEHEDKDKVMSVQIEVQKLKLL